MDESLPANKDDDPKSRVLNVTALMTDSLHEDEPDEEETSD